MRIFFLTLLLILTGGCSEPVPPLSPLSADATILAYGDSLTYGKGADRHESYPAILRQLTSRQVINAGVSGELSEQGLNRLPDVLDEYQPNLVILCHGGNDLLRKRSREALQQNLRSMIELIQSRGIDVVLLGVPEPKLLLRSSPEFYAEIAKEFSIPYEGEVIAEVESDDDLKSDAVHPNAQGYRLMAEAVFELLKESGAL